VVVNLAINARDAMPQGGVITIETRNVTLDEHDVAPILDALPGEYVALYVSDTGFGMSDEVKARLFEPFFTTKAKGQGTGLGMATVYGIVTQSRGQIRVYSELGVGTTIKVYFPADRKAFVPASPKQAQAAADLRGDETILVVEDDRSLRALDEKILKRYGYNVLAAGNGTEARRICTDYMGPIHAVLMDVIMPGDSGPTVGEWIKRKRPEARIVYMSGYTDTAIVHHGVLDPGTHFVQKPFRPETLVRKVREVLT
jgi:two-component system, cell cycle sensor histidine kinase and response regulator CckA